MNIAFLNSIEKNTYGGMEEWIRLVSDGLISRGHRVTLIGRKDSVYLKRIKKSNNNVEIVELDISGDFKPTTIVDIKRLLLKKKIEILSVNFNKDVRLGGLAARFNGNVKVVWSVGIDITRDTFAHRLMTPRLIDRVIVPSQSLKSEITRFGYINDNVIDVIPIGIPNLEFNRSDTFTHDELRKKYELPPDSIVAVTSGRFVEQKGHDVLIKAAPEIIKQHSNIYFLFLGNGNRECLLREMIRDLGIEKHFIFAGMLENTDLELCGSDIMIHPSRVEPFGIAILEGMRAGLPVIATRVGGIPEVVAEGETAILIEPCQPEAIATEVKNLLSDRNRLDNMSKNSLQRFRSQFQFHTMIENIERYLLSLTTDKDRLNNPVP